ncbi:MAG: hypothetical protein KDD47_13175 [Acidobacteria bacterium]|nr:hypothetical protein [Acidobacteriota bacterium]
MKRRDFFFLIRVFDERHDEIARFSMSRYGLVTSYSVAPKPLLSKTEERWQGVVPALADIQEEIRQWFGVEARDPQYVWSLGPRLQCRRELPCVALRSQGETFLYQPRGEGRLFRFATAGPRVSLAERESLASGNGPAIQPPAGDPVADLVSIADQWVRVEEVSRPSAETP